MDRNRFWFTVSCIFVVYDLWRLCSLAADGTAGWGWFAFYGVMLATWGYLIGWRAARGLY